MRIRPHGLPRRTLCGSGAWSLHVLVLLVAALLPSHSVLAAFQDNGAKRPVAARDQALPPRIPWTSSRVAGSPDPPPPYEVRRLFGGLKFKDPVDICVAPGSGRVFVAEQAGKVFSFTPEQTGTRPELAVDLASFN